MSLDIINIDYYRVSSHGGRSFDLFNRKNDKVFTISKDAFQYIKNDQTIGRCQDVERWADHGRTKKV